MNQIKRTLLLTVLAIAASAIPVLAAEGGERYIVILKQHSSPAPEVAKLGGTIEFRQAEELVVTLPAGAVELLRQDPLVKYVQRVAAPGESGGEPPLIGTPAEPQPEDRPMRAAGMSLHPQPQGTITWDSGIYTYDGAGNITAIGTTQSYAYDKVQRLVKATINGTADTFSFDGFGNMTAKSAGGTAQTIPPVSSTTNRFNQAGYTYDGAGNLTGDGSWAFSYDALGQPLSKTYDGTNMAFYVYTASDERIGVQENAWWVWSVRDEGGKVLRQYRTSANNPTMPALWLEDFVWRDGLLLGSERPAAMGGRRHFHLDHLGTPRLITADSGQQISAHDYYPFGDEKTPVGQELPAGFDREEPMKFTGHERDFAGGQGREDGHYIDYMHARYYSPTMGRFLSIDPVLDVKASIGAPQTWNRYTYVRGNPLVLTDPTGRLFAQFTLAANALDEFWSSYSDVSAAMQELQQDTQYYAVVWTDGGRLAHEGIYLVNTKTGAILNVWEHNVGWSKPNEAKSWKESLAYNKGWTPASAKPLGPLSVFGFAPRVGLVNSLNGEFKEARLQCSDYSAFQQSPWKVGVAVIFGHRFVSTSNEDHVAGLSGYVSPAVLPKGFPH